MRASVAPASRSALMLILLQCVIALHTASALKCYDCVSKSIPACVNEHKIHEFEVYSCNSDESFCSVLTMKDSEGTTIVSRQCAAGENEVEDLRQFMEGTLDVGTLQVESFVTCQGDLCNANAVGGVSRTASVATTALLAAVLPLLATAVRV